MDELKFQQGLGRVTIVSSPLVSSNVEERDVSDYHRLLESLGKNRSQQLSRLLCSGRPIRICEHSRTYRPRRLQSV